MQRGIGAVALAVLVCSLAVAQTTVEDHGLSTKFQDGFLGHLKRGRANIAADYDLDGLIDFYIGNPGDESFVMRQVPNPDGSTNFELVQVLFTGLLPWGGAAGDYDNDGDYDLFIATGGNEGIGLDMLFHNEFVETGVLSFTDVTDIAGVAGPVPPGQSQPIPTAAGNAMFVDYDNDGDVDLFVNTSIHGQSLAPLRGRNTLWHNNGDGTFTDVTETTGLGATARPTRHSSFLDIDNDGDLDLYESNHTQRNVLWRNRLKEDGVPIFEDVTDAFTPVPGEDLGYPLFTFGSAVADFNNDGFQDIVAFMRYDEQATEPGSPYTLGHAIFINFNGIGFRNVAEASDVNDGFPIGLGVMGCQVGDLNGDGVADLFMGNGGPPSGAANNLFISDSGIGVDPHYLNGSNLIDFPAPEDPLLGTYPPYPYRTHGTVILDLDEDGLQELAVANGGPSSSPNIVREPNRLFRFDWGTAPSYLKVRPVGNGTTVSRDAINTRVAASVSQGGGTPWNVHGTLLGGGGFNAQNGFEVYLGLKDADTVHAVQITWPDGTVELLDQHLEINREIIVRRDPEGGRIPATLEAELVNGQVQLTWEPTGCGAEVDYGIYEGAIGGDFSGHAQTVCSTGGQTTTTVSPGPGDRYFLVVPRDVQREGSYGRRSDGSERPVGANACLPQIVTECS